MSDRVTGRGRPTTTRRLAGWRARIRVPAVVSASVACLLLASACSGVSEQEGDEAEVAASETSTDVGGDAGADDAGAATEDAGTDDEADDAVESTDDTSEDTTPPEASGEPIAVGVVMSQTGPFAPIGTTELSGIQLAAERINDAGGVDGRMIELQVVDDASDPSRSVTSVRGLIDDGVVAILGPTAGPTVAQTTAITSEAGVLQFLGVAQDLPGATTAQTIFGVPPNIGLWTEAAACYAVDELGAATAAGIFTTDAAGQTTSEAMPDALSSREAELVLSETVAIDATDTSTSWSKIRDANPDVVFDFATGALGGQTLQTARQLGYEGPIIGYVAWGLPAVVQLAGPAGDGVVIAGHVSAQDPAAHQEEFVTAFVEEYGAEALNAYTAYGYDMMSLLGEALGAVPGATQADGAALASALEEDVQMQGVVADFDYGPFDPDDPTPHSGVTLSDIIFFEVTDAATGEMARVDSQPSCS